MSHYVPRKSAVAAALMLLAALAVVPVGVASAQPLECGTVITEDTVLTSDIGPCGDEVTDPGAHIPGGHGLVIGADNVTLDLNGHTIFGLGGSVVLHQAAGVKSNGYSGVTIKNGTVRDFFHGIHVQNGSNNRVVNIHALDNTTGNGIVLQNVSDSEVMHNTVINSGGFGGISVFDGRRAEELDDIPSAGNTIAHNVVDQADNRITTSGISLEDGPNHKVIHNTVTNSAGPGILLLGERPLPGGTGVLAAVTDAQVANNVVAGNGTRQAETAIAMGGIVLRASTTGGPGADGNTIAGNRAYDNSSYGILVESKNNLITGNEARGNSVFDLADTNTSPPCDANRWRGNRFGTANQPCVR